MRGVCPLCFLLHSSGIGRSAAGGVLKSGEGPTGRGWPVCRTHWPRGSTERCRRSPRPCLDPTQAFSEGPAPRWVPPAFLLGRGLAAVPLWQGPLVPGGDPLTRVQAPAHGRPRGPGRGLRPGSLAGQVSCGLARLLPRRRVPALGVGLLRISRALGGAGLVPALSARRRWVLRLNQRSKERERGMGGTQ